jgi:hypothetical protein
MNTKFTILAAAILVGMSTTAMSASANPPAAPSIYASGPESPLVNSTDLSLAERTAYANYEAILEIVEAWIYATSANSAAGTYQISAFSDGSVANPTQNFATILSNGASLTVYSTSTAPDTTANRGQLITVNAPSGALVNTGISNYIGNFAYNGENNLLDATSQVSVVGINGRPDLYYGKVIKDFYRGSLDNTQADYYNIFDWGLQTLDKLGYPVNKYWQASKSHRDDGTNGRTVFVKDRLVGATPVRITIDTAGYNNQDFFEQKGTLTIQTGVLPNDVVPAFSQAPFQ